MRRKFGLASLYFRDGVLSVPGYTFEKARPWHDTGSMTHLVEGSSLKDESNVLAKIAPTQSNGSMCLEREAHILGRLVASDGARHALRIIEFFTIPKDSGDVVVLLLGHPGLNLLGRYLPPSKINDLLLPDVSRGARPPSSHGDAYMMNIEEPDLLDEIGGFDIMDIATFLEFAIQATHCLEAMHKAGVVHREVRANAFHLNSHSGLVRFVHFGNRAVSLESFGSPSSLVLRAFDELEKVKVKEALCYLAPEQTGSIETMTQDHRTDLYSLGILFWTLLVGRGQMPFEGGPLELLHSIVQKRPMPVHEVRRDIPQVLASIIDKLLVKNPDLRYQSARGLMADLLECQRRLLATVSSTTEESSELIPSFETATMDRFQEFTIPLTLFGREKELETVRNVIRNSSASFSADISASNGFRTLGSSGVDSVDDQVDSPHSSVRSLSPMDDISSTSLPSPARSDGLRKPVLRTKTRGRTTHTVIVEGPPGVGKSSIILANQAKWRAHGLWGQAKFLNADSSGPFSTLLSCLAAVLRQLMVFHTDLERFVIALKERLGPQLQNVPLLYHGTPELKDVLALFDIELATPKEHLTTRELRVRFQTLVQNVFAVIAETRLFALFLDDLHEADESTLDLVSTLINSKCRMLIFATMRSDRPEVVERVRSMFTGRSRPTWITLESLSYTAIGSMVSKTLHRPNEDCIPLTHIIYKASCGNAFSARNVLTTLQRQHHIKFNREHNYWDFDVIAAEESLGRSEKISDPTDLSFLISNLRQLPEDGKRYIRWAAMFGETFNLTELAQLIDGEDNNGGSSGEEEGEDRWILAKPVALNAPDTATMDNASASMRGLQTAIDEGWIIQRARDMCSFAHDRYRQAAQAEAASLTEDVVAKMSYRIVLMMISEIPIDVYRIAEHATHCLPLLYDHPKHDEMLDVLIDAGESAWARGAHELAMRSFTSARTLLRKNPWITKPRRSLNLFRRLAALTSWEGNYEDSELIIQECLDHAEAPEDKGSLLWQRSRNKWLVNQFGSALNDTLLALNILGVEINPTPTRRDADRLFNQVHNEILAVGFDEILAMPRTQDPRIELAVALLNDAGINAFWSSSPFTIEVIGCTTIRLALRSGMSPGTALGFFWALGAAAERKELYRLSVDLAQVAIKLADLHGGSADKCRAHVLYTSMVSGYDTVHIRANLDRMQIAMQYGHSAGDRVYTSFASIHSILTRLYVCEHLSDLLIATEECVGDVNQWAPKGPATVLIAAVLNCVRAMAGHTIANSAATAFDTETFQESEYILYIHATSGNVPLALNWYNSLKVVGLFCLGYVTEAATLGFEVYATRDRHPNHRHARYGLFFHSLALLACLRGGRLSDELQRRKYLEQVHNNQAFISRWRSPSPVNTSTWVALVDAELASLQDSPDALRLYDTAVRLAVANDWINEEGWALYLQGSHFVRLGVEGLGLELQRRGISRHAQWGAKGIVDYLTSTMGSQAQAPPTRTRFFSDVAVQTDSMALGMGSLQTYGPLSAGITERQQSKLNADDLWAILKSSQDISSDINLSSALQRLTEVSTDISGSQNTCVVIAREAGDYTLATSMTPPEPCQVYENPRSVRTISDPLQKAIIGQTLNTKEPFYCDDASLDPKFSAEAAQSVHRSVICLPIRSNRGQTFGAVYFASKYEFSQNTVTMLTLLCQQASISVANALLFRSVQAGTRENLKMIAAQRDALEAARKSREDALRATKIKGNFLASMSHELRTPFSSFYGLLDLLSGTELDPGQSEIVQTAKNSCELLLRIIDSILDYSKLEASAVKLEPSGFLVESIIADCMELLLPMAAQKLDLTFNIEADVPAWVYSDYARIRQVLMNLIGNAVKFTAGGSVRVLCSVDGSMTAPDEVHLKFAIQDTGIGLTSSDVELLFVPFQQADNSSTRRFGGTGLGLSISRQIVKLMGGAIGVHSQLNVGSTFYFTIPVKIYDSDESRKYFADLEKVRSVLLHPRPLQILVCSASEDTLAFLKTMFNGFHTTLVSTLSDAELRLRTFGESHPPLDFIILDDQSETHADEIAIFLRSLGVSALQETKIIHMYTPTMNRSSHSIFSSNTPGVIKMTKPPRQARILQTLAGLKDLPNAMPSTQFSHVARAIESLTTAKRTLFGNVLVAEDNLIAQNLLVKQLQKHDLNVVATSDGNEALAEWQKHEPGYFSVALFDHHMPVCDGVEAAKRLRHLEEKRNVPVALPIIALSADCQESTKQLCLSAGMNAFFSKPLKRSDLLSLLSMFGAPPA